MNPNTKKVTPVFTSFIEDKWGDYSVKDMSVSLTKSDKNIIPKCELCGQRHKVFEDGFEFFDCWNHKIRIKELKKKRGQNE